MAHAIPKIDWQIIEVTGDTEDLNIVINNVSDTTEIEVGMFVTGSGIPAGATVISKTTTTVTLSVAATVTVADDDLEFFWTLELEFPPIEKLGELRKPQERRSVSLSGQTQVSIDHIEATRNLIFSHLTNTIYEDLLEFYEESAVYGESFRYYDDKTTSSFLEYELKNLDWLPQKVASRGTSYVWAVPLEFRRVL